MTAVYFMRKAIFIETLWKSSQPSFKAPPQHPHSGRIFMTPPCRIPGYRLQAQLPHSIAMMCQRGSPLQPVLTEGRGWHQLYAWFPQRGSEMLAELMQKKKITFT